MNVLLILCLVAEPPLLVPTWYGRRKAHRRAAIPRWVDRDEALRLVARGCTVQVVDRQFYMAPKTAEHCSHRVICGWNTPIRFEDRQVLIPSRWP
jgi:hypothetical protein